MYLERDVRPSNRYFLAVALNLMLGVFSCGFALVGNSNVGEILAVQLNWEKNNVTRNTIWISTSATIGLTAGALLSKPITARGRRMAII